MENKKLVIHPKKSTSEDGYKTFSVRIKGDLVAKINSISKQTGYSRNELIGCLLEYAVDNCTIAEK